MNKDRLLELIQTNSGRMAKGDRKGVIISTMCLGGDRFLDEVDCADWESLANVLAVGLGESTIEVDYSRPLKSVMIWSELPAETVLEAVAKLKNNALPAGTNSDQNTTY